MSDLFILNIYPIDILEQPSLTGAMGMPAYPSRRAVILSFCWLVALWTPRTHVPPAWWQGGWRRPPISSVKEVELLSQLAAVLMPKTPVEELFRSFPSPDGETILKPSLTAHGVLKDPQAALFVVYDCTGNGKGMESKLKRALLAYGPLGSHILYIGHKESRPLEEKVLCVKVRDWKTGDRASLLEVLTGLKRQFCLGLGQVIRPEILQQLERKEGSILRRDTEDYRKIADALSGEAARREIRSCLRATGFGLASIKHMQKCILLNGNCAEAELQSRIHWLLNSDQRPSQVAKAVAACSPALGNRLTQNLRNTQQWFLDSGLRLNQATKVTAMFLSIVHNSAEHSLQPIVNWLLDLGLSTRQIAKTMRLCPEVLGCTVECNRKNVQRLVDLVGLTKVQVLQITPRCPESLSNDLSDKAQWFVDFGLTAVQTAKLIASYPQILAFDQEQNLKPKVQWLLDLGMTKKQVLKAITVCPQIFRHNIGNLKLKVQWFLKAGMQPNQLANAIAKCPSILLLDIERSLKPKVAYLFDLGLTEDQIAKATAAFPSIFGLGTESTLKPKVQWLLNVGLTQTQVAKVIALNPHILGRSIERNFIPKAQWLVELGLTRNQVARAIMTFPQILGLSVERNLKPKLQWLGELGLRQDQILKIVSSVPWVLKYSLSNNLAHKKVLLQSMLGTVGAAETVLKQPRILGMSYLRLSERLQILARGNETMKLSWAMQMTEQRFQARFS